MVSFSSSAINKSGKKFAPKAPIRRAPPAPKPPPVAAPPAPQRRPSVGQQGSPSQPDSSAIDPTAVSHDPLTQAVESSVSSSTPTETPAVEPNSRKPKSIRPDAPTPIPVPRPERKPSISAPAPNANELKSTPSQPTPLSHSTSTTEPPSVPLSVPPEPEEPDDRADSQSNAEISQDLVPRGDVTPSSEVSKPNHISAGATEIRPAKRRKTTPEETDAAETSQPAAPQLATPPATQPQASEVEETTIAAHQTTSHAPADRGRKPVKVSKKRVKNGDSDASSGTTRTKRRPRKQREPTPDGAENIEIAPTVVKMSDLCKDLRTGKMSKRETELRNMELAEVERKRKAEEDGDNEQTPIKQNGDVPSPAPIAPDLPEAKAQSGPVMRIVNGEIVLDTASLQVDRHADAERNAGVLEDVVENSLTRKINQSTYGKRTKAESWDEEMTDLFYRGLRMFGTDFMMISKLFPNRSRHQIKLKFNNEERRHPERIKETLLGPSEAIDIATYSEMTNAVYDDPKLVQQELDEDKKRIEEQHAKEKEAQEEMLRNPGGVDGANASDAAADAPVKGKLRNNKRQVTESAGGGTEEVVGSIDDIP
ncbi:transcription factor TFIIIB [Aspergillus sclerotialis]|uniref:Transcription factor TFIIIB n=1 Tax=Aspergillus sclerotialis TaxID=2070753 RepID=A0A3A2ZGE6_9EURO|nr:transcription factor TFIIIB [Aspergillus sclerotialis]